MRDQIRDYTLDEALSTVGYGKFQYLVLAYAGLGWVTEAMEINILSFIGPAVKSEWGLSSSEESLISTVVFAGMLFGAFLWGYMADAHGRKKAFLGAAIVTAGVGVISTFSPNYTWLIIFRCLIGIGLGGGHVFMSWFLEFVPTPNRGAWMILFSSFWTVGTVFEASIAWIVMPRLGWRWLLGLSSLPCFSVIFLSSFVPESPRYLCTKGRTNEARTILQKVATCNQTELPVGTLISDQKEDSNQETASSGNFPLLPLQKETINGSRKCLSSFFSLLSANLIRTTLLLWVLFFSDTFSYYGIVLLTSELSQNKCGSVTLHSNMVQEASPYLDVFITSFAEFPGLLLSAVIVDRIGRKHSMLILTILGFILLLPLVSHQHEILITASLFGARMFIFATFIVAYVYAPEVYPTYVRSTGVGIATAIGRVGGMICPLLAVAWVNDCHQRAAVVLFEVVIILSGLCVQFLPLETTGRHLTDYVPLSNS